MLMKLEKIQKIMVGKTKKISFLIIIFLGLTCAYRKQDKTMDNARYETFDFFTMNKVGNISGDIKNYITVDTFKDSLVVNYFIDNEKQLSKGVKKLNDSIYYLTYKDGYIVFDRKDFYCYKILQINKIQSIFILKLPEKKLILQYA